MKNPYADIVSEDEIRIGRRGLLVWIVIFILLLLIPGASLLDFKYRNGEVEDAGGSPSPSTLRGWMTRLEGGAKKLPLLEHWRQVDQARLSRYLGAGNQRVLGGRKGWLYYRSDLDAITGKGPYYEEPASVARERFDRSWQSPVPVIKAFAGELTSRGIRLVIVPVPTKPMICREGLGLPATGSTHPEFSRVVEDLTTAGIEVVDLFPLLTTRPKEEERFLKQDTHWTPAMAEEAAREVALRVASPGGGGTLLLTRAEKVERESRGDLVGMLDLGEKQQLYPPERVSLRRVLREETGEPLSSDPQSGVVVLGDSFVNIYEDPALGFGEGKEASIGAGFSSHLATALGQTVHTIAINGGGATGVREAFAGLPDDQVRAKKTVIWVLSSRDLLLAEIPARRAGIEWRSVTFNQEQSNGAGSVRGAVEVIATLREKSTIEDPAQTPYAAATYSTLFEVVERVGGDQPEGTELNVFFWAFRERKLEPGARLEPGRTYRLRLVPLADHGEANRATRLDDFFRPELTPWFAVDFSEIQAR